MRKEYGKILRSAFTHEMKERLSQFKPVKIESYYIFPGERIFRWIPVSPLHCFIILSPDRKGYDEFGIEISWSKLERFPKLSMRPSMYAPYSEETFAKSEFVCNLEQLCPEIKGPWELSSIDVLRDDPMEVILKKMQPVPVEEAKEKVQFCIDDAIKKTIQCGLPYLEEFIEYHKKISRND